MSVAQITHVFLPHVGGLELYVYRLARDLANAQEEVDVLTTDMSTYHGWQKYDFNFNLTQYKANLTLLRNPFSWGLFKHLKDHDYDILHLHSMWFVPSIFAALFKKNAKIIMTVHGVYPDKLPWHQKLMVKLYKPFAKLICRKTDTFIVLSDSEKEKLQKHFKVPDSKIKVVPNGFDYHEPENSELADYMNMLELGHKILFTGRILPIKSPELLIEAISKTQESFQIFFVGPINEKYKHELMDLAHGRDVLNKLHFMGSFDPINQKDDLMAMYQAADLSVSIGQWEGLPTRIFESLYNGTPCVLYSPNNETFQDNVNCFKINNLDSGELASKLDEAMDKKKYDVVKNNGVELANDFEWQKIFRQIYREYYKD